MRDTLGEWKKWIKNTLKDMRDILEKWKKWIKNILKDTRDTLEKWKKLIIEYMSSQWLVYNNLITQDNHNQIIPSDNI